MRLALALPFVCAAALVARAAAQEPPPPVEVTVEGMFGPEALVDGGYAAVLVTLASRSAETVSGTLALTAADWDAVPERHEVAVDLPAGEVRRVPVTVFVASSDVAIAARYLDADGAELGRASTSVSYAAGARPILLVNDRPASLRAALLDLQVEEIDTSVGAYPSASGRTRTVAVPVGVASLDPRTGDPMLPTEALAYAPFRLVHVSLPALTRLGPAALRALEDHVVAGGDLVLEARSAADWSLPFVREHFGEVSERPDLPAAPLLVPIGTPSIACSRAERVDGAGCVRRHGQGRIRLLPAGASAVTSPDTTSIARLFRALLDEAGRDPAPGLPFGAGVDPTQTSWWAGGSTFGWMRRALDPNESYRASLSLVAVLLLFYVVVIGPVHFKLVERRNQPTLALVTTPLLALACTLVLFVVGYLGKGVLMRYRRVAVVELAEGAARGTSRAYTGLFFTRPTSASWTSPAGAVARRIAAASGTAGPSHLHREGRVDIENLRGGLWDTLFVREDVMIDVPGGIRFERGPERIAAVLNESAWALESAFLLDSAGTVYPVGDVPAHGRASVSGPADGYLADGTAGWWAEGGDATTDVLRGHLGLAPEDRPLATAVQSLLANGLHARDAIVLYAWIQPAPPPSVTPGFEVDWDRRLVRVESTFPPAALAPAEPSARDAPPVGVEGLDARPTSDDVIGGS